MLKRLNNYKPNYKERINKLNLLKIKCKSYKFNFLNKRRKQ